MRSSYFLLSAVLLLSTSSYTHAQWLKLDPIARQQDLPEGQRITGELEINDLGQALYPTYEFGGRREPDIFRMFVDDQLVVTYVREGGDRGNPRIGEINDNGTFTYVVDEALFVAELDGTTTQIVQCCDMQLNYLGFATLPINKSQIDGEGRPYFIGSTPEQMPHQNNGGYRGTGSIYTGTGIAEDLREVFGEVNLVEFESDVRNAFTAFDVNEHGDMVVAGGVIPAGEQVTGWQVSIGSQTSINNHGQFTQLTRTETDEGFVPSITVVESDGFETFLTGIGVSRAFINDQRKVAFEDQDDGLHMLDTETGEITTLIDPEDTDKYFRTLGLTGFNDAGQMSVRLIEDDDESSINLYRATAQGTPIADLNFDSEATAADVDELASEIREGGTKARFDLTQDGLVDSDDIDFWVEELVGTTVGDTDLDLDVDFKDFLMLSSEFGNSAGWAGGDFDGSGETQFNDFLSLSNAFGTTSQPVAVPEPCMNFRFTLLLYFVSIQLNICGSQSVRRADRW